MTVQLLLSLLCLVTPISGDDDVKPWFRDVSEERGIQPGGAAVAFGDLDGDGWVDVLAGSVWLNQEGERFVKKPGPGHGILGDVDADGDLDAFIHAGRRLFLNDGEAGFQELKLPDFPKGPCRGAVFGDFTGDGRLDLYAGGYENWDDQITYLDVILVQDFDTWALDHEDDRYRARGVTSADFDEDGDLDVYVSNYRLQPNLLLQNDGAGGFEDVAADHNAVATSGEFEGGHSIGSAFGDFDNDGHLDLFAGNFAHRDYRGNQPESRFLRSLGPAGEFRFEDLGPCGVHYQESYASPAVADFDNDGDLDLYFTTVYATASHDTKNNAALFRNDGDWVFRNVTGPAGLAGMPPTYQAAWADYDQDGDLDLMTGGRLYENTLLSPGKRDKERAWVEVILPGGPKHPSPIGTVVRLKKDGQVLTRQVETGTGEGNQNDSVLHFGLAKFRGTASLEVTWPGGKTKKYGVRINRRVEIRR